MKNDLLLYFNTTLEENYVKVKTLKENSNSSVTLYKHIDSENQLIVRKSKFRNDDVYRLLKGIRIEQMPQIYDVCSTDDELIVLEEYIVGKSLLEYINDTPIKKRTACKYAIQICDALKILHSKGIIHRDIKPSNVIIKDGKAVLIDLSIARINATIKDQDTQHLGTVGFAAPEQFGICQTGFSTDIYSLGVLLNMMITGEHPSVRIPKGYVGKIIKKATNLQISKRYQSASEMRKVLRLAIF